MVNEAYLLVSRGEGQGGFFRLLPEHVTTIGRANANRVVLLDDICSRYHCELFSADGIWFIRDLESRNGTFLDEDRVVQDQQLSDGQVIKLGSTELRFGHDLDALRNQATDRLESDTNAGFDEQVEQAKVVHRISDTRFDMDVENISSQPARETNELIAHLGFLCQSAKSEEELANVVLDAVKQNANADLCAVLLLPEPIRKGETETVQEFRLVASYERPDQKYRSIPRSISREVMNRFAAVVALESGLQKGKSVASLSYQELAPRSVICVPIIFQNPNNDKSERLLYGLIHLYATEVDTKFNTKICEQTFAMAALMGAALARLESEQNLRQGLEQARTENAELVKQLKNSNKIVGRSLKMVELIRQVEQIAQSDSVVLVRGESGVGKELISRAIHLRSQRATGPFVCMNCAALSESLLESELFGHEKGSFTGATGRKSGKFEQAHKGTLFLDEVGEMSPSVQAKFLRVLEGHAFERVGGSQQIDVDVRIVAATNRDLEQSVREGTFRKDLYFRLHVIEVMVPPLRERRDDIPILSTFFMTQIAERSNRQVEGFSPAANRKLMEYEWPGNVRELQHVVERAVVLCRDGLIQPEHLMLSSLELESSLSPEPTHQENQMSHSVPFRQQPEYVPKTLETLEKEHIMATLNNVDWNKSKAAQILGIERSTLDRKLKRWGLNRPIQED